MPDIIRGDIRYNPEKHTYWHIPTGQYLTSVSKVIDTVFPSKSWDIKPGDTIEDIAVKMDRVKHAQQRGIKVDGYISEYVKTGTVYIKDEPEDVEERCLIAHRIWEEEFGNEAAEPQKTVFSLDDKKCGTMDFLVSNEIIVDLKCTYNIEKAWIIQLGAYATYEKKAKRTGVIHVSPKLYKDKGGRWLEYDPEACKRYWKMATDWYDETTNMKARL